mmetsp:Transcript_46739/g.93049  ORF Transcript_46739/g.93049 Transcript_46739/m.93049 type:complete len:124 (+) Transcript_46739:476-847(+)
MPNTPTMLQATPKTTILLNEALFSPVFWKFANDIKATHSSDTVKIRNKYIGPFQNNNFSQKCLQLLLSCTYKFATLEEIHGERCIICVKTNQTRTTAIATALKDKYLLALPAFFMLGRKMHAL